MSSDDFADILFEELEKMNDSVSSTIEALEIENEKEILKRNLFSSKQVRLAQIGDIFFQKYIKIVKKTHDKKITEKYFEEEKQSYFERIKSWFAKEETEENDVTHRWGFEKLLNRCLVFAVGFNFFMGGKIKEAYDKIKEVFLKIVSYGKVLFHYMSSVLTSDEAKEIYKECFNYASIVYSKIKKAFEIIGNIIGWEKWLDEIVNYDYLGFVLSCFNLTKDFVVSMWSIAWGAIGDAIESMFSGGITGNRKNELGVDVAISDISLINYMTHGVIHHVELTEEVFDLEYGYKTEYIADTNSFVTYHRVISQKLNEEKSKIHKYDALVGYKTRNDFFKELRNAQSDVLSRTISTFINATRDLGVESRAVSGTNTPSKHFLKYETHKEKNDLLAIYNEVSYFKLDMHYYNEMVKEPMQDIVNNNMIVKSIESAMRFFFMGLLYSLSLPENRRIVARDLLSDQLAEQFNLTQDDVFERLTVSDVELGEASFYEKEIFKTPKPSEKEIEIYKKEQSLIVTFNALRRAAEEQRVTFQRNIFDSVSNFISKVHITFDEKLIQPQ